MLGVVGVGVGVMGGYLCAVPAVGARLNVVAVFAASFESLWVPLTLGAKCGPSLVERRRGVGGELVLQHMPVLWKGLRSLRAT